jgi:HEAT repeat protein
VVALLLALGRCGKSYVARRVLPYLDHPSRDVRAAAAKALGRIGDGGQRDALWSALRYAPDDPTFTVRAALLGAFAELGWKDEVRKAIEELEAAGARRHWEALVALLHAVGEAGIAERAPWVRQEISSDDPRVVAAAAEALARLGERDEVARCLRHASPVVRRAALVALAQGGDPKATEAALGLVREDPDVDVRFAAALVLDRAGHKDGDLYLVDALKARDPVIWITALSALEKRHRRSFGRDPEAWTEYLKGE